MTANILLDSLNHAIMGFSERPSDDVLSAVREAGARFENMAWHYRSVNESADQVSAGLADALRSMGVEVTLMVRMNGPATSHPAFSGADIMAMEMRGDVQRLAKHGAVVRQIGSVKYEVHPAIYVAGQSPKSIVIERAAAAKNA